MSNHTRKNTVTKTVTSLLCGSAMCLCLPAFAQDAPDETQDDEAAKRLIPVVTVGVRKRAESAQDVPASVTAIGGEQVDKLDITSIERVAARVPNLTVGRGSTGNGAQITLRGVGPLSTSAGIEQSVAVVVDGAYYGQGRIINEAFFDVEQVEIVAGPQALFFGKNATAGVINIETAGPSDEVEFLARASYEFTGEQYQIDGIASGPISETLGARLAVRYSDMSGGYYDNVALPRSITTTDIATGTPTTSTARPSASKQPAQEEIFGRLTLQWDPSESIANEFKLSGLTTENNNASWNATIYDCETPFSTVAPTLPCGPGFVIQQNQFPDQLANFPLSRSDGSLFSDYDSWSVNNTLNFTLDDFLVTSVTNFQQNTNTFGTSGSGQSAAVGNQTWVTEDSTWTAFSQEVRALSDFDGSFNFMIGGLYQETERELNQNVFFAFLPLTNSAAAPGREAVHLIKDSETEGTTFAIFGQAIFDITDELELTAGLRYTQEDKDSFFVQTSPFLPLFRDANSADGLGRLVANQEFEDVSPDVTLRWRPSDTLTLFASYREAYKSGGFSNGALNSAISADPLSDFVFDEETASGLEAGLKSELFDRQFRFNVTVYDFDYEDFQVDFFNAALVAFQTLGADINTTGIETQFEYVPTEIPGLNLHAALNYTDAKYTGFPDAPCYSGQTPAQGCSFIFDATTGDLRPITGTEAGVRQNLNGTPLSVAAEWTGQAGFAYDGQLSDTFDFSIGADIRYSDEYITSGFGQEASIQPSYTTLDAFASITNGSWDLALIGKNLTDEFYITGGGDAPGTGTGTGTAAGVRSDQLGFGSLPRTVLLRATKRF